MAGTLDLDIRFLNAAGDGVAVLPGRQVLVPFTIPGERVRASPGPTRDGTTVAVLHTVLRPSPHRVAPRCRHFGLEAQPGVGPCGGCTWQHIAYAEQLRLKTALVTRLVRARVPRAPAAHPMLPGTGTGEPWGYRQKVHFVVGGAPRGGAPAVGHYVRGSRRVVPVRECPVHDERGNTVAFRFRDAFVDAGLAAAGSTLKGVLVRVGHGTGEAAATVVVAREADRRLRAATRRVLDGPGAPTSCHVNLHPRDDAFLVGSRTRTIKGPERLRERVGGIGFLVSPTAFFQTNVQAAELLVRHVLAAVPPGARVLDLYAGAGLFALPLARAGHHVVAVEDSPPAVADGEASRRLNGIPERLCTFIARRVEQALAARDARPPFDAVVLDPPRDGCSPPVIRQVFGSIAPRIAVYVSCNPEALARDLAAITGHGYRIRSMQPIDMFPHTAHVETVVTLDR